MKSSFFSFYVKMVVILLHGCLCASEIDVSIDIDVTQTKHVLQDTLYGVFYEDINYSADGGLYAELIENRSFEYYPILNGALDSRRRGYLLKPLFPWEKVERQGAVCELSVTNTSPLNSHNTNYVKVNITQGGGEAGLRNRGYDGIPVVSGECYRVSFYVRYEGSVPPSLTASIRGEHGDLIAQDFYSGVTGSWQKFESLINVERTDPRATFEITTCGSGLLCLDMISLFPCKTYKNRPNGLRPDLAQAIADLKPATFRFPGGCITHGNGLANAYRWKNTIGDVAERKPNWNRWGYHQSFGLGFFEYFQFCEDIGAEPIPIVPVGVSCAFQGAGYVPMNELQEWVDDVVDLIEFANGPVDSEWGAKRAAMGHPEPFGLKYIGLGNEEPATLGFRERFPPFVEAIRANYPDIKIVGTSGWWSTTPNYAFMCEQHVDLADEHYYQSPAWYIQNVNRFDGFDRSKPKIYIGEYASGSESPANILYTALSEAYYLTGVERNADMVYMTAYAPLLARYDFNQWTPNMIWFDHEKLVKTPNYYVQQLFSLNKGDFTLQHSVQKYTTVEDIGVAASIEKDGSEIILKLVNPFNHEFNLSINLLTGQRFVANTATLITLSGGYSAENTRTNPHNVVPQQSDKAVSASFEHAVPPYSLQILRMKMQPFRGAGTLDDPYLIFTKEDLLRVARNTEYYDDCFMLMANIDCKGESFERAVIAPNVMSGSLFFGVPFSGVIFGNGYKVCNVHIKTGGAPECFLGLFGMVEDAVISGLGVEGIIIDDAEGSSWCVGGFCGQNMGSLIQECHVNNATLLGGTCIGGFCGLNSYDSVISNCYAQGVLSGSVLVGGFCGYNYRSSAIEKSYAVCSIVAGHDSGGFCAGMDATSWIINSFWDMDVCDLASSNGGTGKTTDKMMNQATFSGWNFVNLWQMGDYPVLRVFDHSVDFADWLEIQAVPPSLRGEGDSPAGDNVPNLIKYACGLPAMLPATTADLMNLGTDEANRFSVLYRISKTAKNVNLEPLWSDCLAGPWVTNGLLNIWLGDDIDIEKWKSFMPKSDRGFIKLRATQLP